MASCKLLLNVERLVRESTILALSFAVSRWDVLGPEHLLLGEAAVGMTLQDSRRLHCSVDQFGWSLLSNTDN